MNVWQSDASNTKIGHPAYFRETEIVGVDVVREPGSLPRPELKPGLDLMPKIEHIIVLMLENHSYDNYLGMLGRMPGEIPRGDGFEVDRMGRPVATNMTADDVPIRAFRMPTTCQLPHQPSQEWVQSHVQFDEGHNDGFVRSASGPVAMGYWTEEDLPWSYSLARTFPLCDKWFSSILGQTFPNRRFLLAGTSVGSVNDFSWDILSNLREAPNGTIFQLLERFGISWRNYYSSYPSSAVFLGNLALSNRSVRPIKEFFEDASSGSLPFFSLVDPDFSKDSGENPQNIVHAEAFSYSVVDAVMNSPAWMSTVLIVTFDEGGGYFDHVPPPPAIPPDDRQPDVQPGFDGFGRYGFRVPAVVISPWAKPQYVSSCIRDHTTVLATVQAKWNLPALTSRDANTPPITDCLDFDAAAFEKPPALVPPSVTKANCACETTGPGQIPPGSVMAMGPSCQIQYP